MQLVAQQVLLVMLHVQALPLQALDRILTYGQVLLGHSENILGGHVVDQGDLVVLSKALEALVYDPALSAKSQHDLEHIYADQLLVSCGGS